MVKKFDVVIGIVGHTNIETLPKIKAIFDNFEGFSLVKTFALFDFDTKNN